VHIILDNTKCQKDLKDVTMKLTRKIQCVSNHKNVIELVDTLMQKTFEGVPKGQKEEKMLEMILIEEKQDNKKIK